MLARLQHGHTALTRLALRPVSDQLRSKVTVAKSAKSRPTPKTKDAPKTTAAPKTKKAPSMLAATSAVAKQLDKTGVWKKTGGRKKADAIRAVEPRRVNIVSDVLCGKLRTC